jgi:hypothetical protein
MPRKLESLDEAIPRHFALKKLNDGLRLDVPSRAFVHRLDRLF